MALAFYDAYGNPIWAVSVHDRQFSLPDLVVDSATGKASMIESSLVHGTLVRVADDLDNDLWKELCETVSDNWRIMRIGDLIGHDERIYIIVRR